jgi:plastocyanin
MRRITASTILAAMTLLALAGGTPAEAGGGCHDDKLTDERGVEVALEKRCFEPTVVRVDPGQQVTFTNKDPDAHTVTGVANSWGTYDELGQGDTVSYQFDKAGVFPYFCVLHPSMVGAVVVGDGVPSAATRTAADDGVKAVSAQAPGGEAVEAEAQAIAETDDDGLATRPLVIGVGVLAAGAGFAGAFVIRRKSASSE